MHVTGPGFEIVYLIFKTFYLKLDLLLPEIRTSFAVLDQFNTSQKYVRHKQAQNG